MVLQVHDELVFDAHHEEITLLQQHVPKMMREALPLAVPIEVDIKVGPNWLESLNQWQHSETKTALK